MASKCDNITDCQVWGFTKNANIYIFWERNIIFPWNKEIIHYKTSIIISQKTVFKYVVLSLTYKISAIWLVEKSKYCPYCTLGLNNKKRQSLLEVFCKKHVIKNLSKFTGKHMSQSLFFHKKRLWHRCFPVNFEKFLTLFTMGLFQGC